MAYQWLNLQVMVTWSSKHRAPVSEAIDVQRLSCYQLAYVLALGFAAISLTACSGRLSSPPPLPTPPAAPLAPDYDSIENTIRFLEDRVKRDPDDIIAYNKLTGYYLQRLRETGSLNYLDLASRAAHASLNAVSASIGNTGGLAGLAQVEYAAHEFAAARDHAKELMERDPSKSYPYQILADSLLELGDYVAADAILAQMERRSDGTQSAAIGIETRLGRLSALRGDAGSARRHFNAALIDALNLDPAPRETVAWCRWQLGEIAFSTGGYEAAEQHYRDALITFPDYYRALASLGRVRAARGDLVGAIEQYERAVCILPDPAFVAALGDLYRLEGRDKEAAAKYALVEQIGRLSVLGGALYNRQLAVFYADHDMMAEEAYANAAREYDVRRDIYGADAVAWTALKAGKIARAQSAINEALKLGTRDARLYYHAGMIARAAGRTGEARDYLKRALTVCPKFDAVQALRANQVLEEMGGK